MENCQKNVFYYFLFIGLVIALILIVFKVEIRRRETKNLLNKTKKIKRETEEIQKKLKEMKNLFKDFKKSLNTNVK